MIRHFLIQAESRKVFALLRAADMVFSDCPASANRIFYRQVPFLPFEGSDADGLHSPSGLKQPFSGPPCPETSGSGQDNGNYQYPPQVANPKLSGSLPCHIKNEIFVHSLFLPSFAVWRCSYMLVQSEFESKSAGQPCGYFDAQTAAAPLLFYGNPITLTAYRRIWHAFYIPKTKRRYLYL